MNVRNERLEGSECAIRRRDRAVLLFVLLVGLSCGDSSTWPTPPLPSPPPQLSLVTVTPATAELTALGDTVRLSAEVRDQAGRVMPGVGVSWSSGDTAVVTVDAAGLVTAAGVGTAGVTARAGTVAREARVSVRQSTDSVVVTPSVVELVALGDTVRLLAEAWDANGHPVTGAVFNWSSSDTSVATVDSTGLTTSVGNGVALITVAAGATDASTIVVVEQLPASIVLTVLPNPMSVGDSLQLTATLRDGAGAAITGATFLWESSNLAVATVDQRGWVQVRSTGEANIGVTSNGLHASSALVTLGEAVGRVLLDGEPAAGFTVRLRGGGVQERVTDDSGEYRFLNLRSDDQVCIRGPSSPGCYSVSIFGQDLGFDILRFGFQINEERFSVDLGAVTVVESFAGYSIPECETANSIVDLRFVNNDPMFDDYYRSAVCRWTSIVVDIQRTPCLLGPPDQGVLVEVEYVDDFDEAGGQLILCDGEPWRASFRTVHSDRYNPEHWLVPPQVYSQASRNVAFALGVLQVSSMPAWSAHVSSDSAGAVFTGLEATGAFQALGGTGHPRLVVTSGQSFWRSGVMCNEAHGPVSMAGTSQPISSVTIGALIDTGFYEVDGSAAEVFRPSTCVPSAGDTWPAADASGPALSPLRVLNLRARR
ncbi:Ig-like domain-containing protein [Candidatus Palauibacter sp.]|uniref:Ig-like domain-containing protein n=1 Tax=Candidatus Palauibacter sp. TaxID=3101350 RepID=UPI003B51F8E5